jgi:hypothetical protein
MVPFHKILKYMQDTTASLPPGRLPADVQQLARMHKLGLLQHIYVAKSAMLLTRALGASCILLGGLLIALSSAFSATLFDASSGAPPWLSLLVFLLGPLWLAVGLWLLLASFLRPHMLVLQFEHGLIYSARKQEVIRWNQIAELHKHVRIVNTVWSEQEERIFRSYTLQRTDGARFTLTDDLQGLTHLGRNLETQVTHHQLPLALQTYNAALPVSFGPLTIHQQGIAVGADVSRRQTPFERIIAARQAKQPDAPMILPWQQVAHISISDLSMSIYQRGEAEPWAMLSSATIPNLGVLKALIDHIRATLSATPLSTSLTLYQAGLSLAFGAISISRQGVTVRNGAHFSWQEIASIAVGARELLIRKQGEQQWIVLPLELLTDTATLRALLEAILRGQAHLEHQ